MIVITTTEPIGTEICTARIISVLMIPPTADIAVITVAANIADPIIILITIKILTIIIRNDPEIRFRELKSELLR